VHFVVNHLSFSEPVDPVTFAAVDDLRPRFEAIDGFEAAHVVQTGEREVVLLIVGRDAETLDRVATEVGSPWMREAVVPLLGAPPQRELGPVIASTSYVV
jgi:hypothetical protein